VPFGVDSRNPMALGLSARNFYLKPEVGIKLHGWFVLGFFLFFFFKKNVS
jgi:hypothetical protein